MSKVKKLEIKGHKFSELTSNVYILHKIKPLKKTDFSFLKWKNVQVEKQVIQ